MKTLNAAICETIEAALELGKPFNAMDVAARVENDYPDVIKHESPSIVRRYIKYEAKKLMRRFEEDDLQGTLFNLPSAISILGEDGNRVMIPTKSATWTVLQLGLEERQKHIGHAVEKHRLMRNSMKALKPFMSKNPDMTVAEAMALVHKN